MPIELTGLAATDQQKTTQNSQVKVSATEPSVAQQQTGTNNTPDTVTITDIASKLNNVENNLSILPVVDTQRVEEIKRLVDQGSYDFNSTRVAEKFVEFERQLLLGLK